MSEEFHTNQEKGCYLSGLMQKSAMHNLSCCSFWQITTGWLIYNRLVII